jgi:isopenicillin-N epimerase
MPRMTDFAKLWQLDPSITFLNHGSFGACPRAVLQAQARYRDELEAEPVRFFTRIAPALLDGSRQVLAEFLHGDADDLVFISNATAGVNSVLRSLRLAPGDELLVTDHAYRACRNVFDYVAQRQGATVVVAALPFPVTAAGDVVEAVLRCVTPRTKLAMIDHVTSATGLVLPVEALVRGLQSRGVDVLVDGAHAPGMVPIDLNALNAAYYTGNLHKWVCAPKGAGFLHVRRDRQAGIMPNIISHGYSVPRPGRSRLHDLFDWVGTLDVSPWLCVKEAIAFIRGLVPPGPGEDGSHALMRHNRDLALRGRRMLCEALGSAPASPEEMIGSLAAVWLPDDPDPEGGRDESTSPTPQHSLQSALMSRFSIEVPAYHFPKPPRRVVRISAQVYNDVGQYQRLIEALQTLIAAGR